MVKLPRTDNVKLLLTVLLLYILPNTVAHNDNQDSERNALAAVSWLPSNTQTLKVKSGTIEVWASELVNFLHLPKAETVRCAHWVLYVGQPAKHKQ